MGDWTIEQGEREGWSPNVMRKLRETTDVQREGFAKALEAGVRIAFGTDSGTYPHGMNAHQFATMVKLGMTPIEAIRSRTSSMDAAWAHSTVAMLDGRAAQGHPTR